MSEVTVHSQEYISDHRYNWWNKDYIKLLLDRIKFDSVESIADLGTGAVHWSALLLSETRNHIDLTCVDFEEHWLKEVSKTLSRFSKYHKVTTLLSDVHNLNIENNQFDLTTCQTLLMHCKDPLTALSEMMRITKPGGYILAIEPTNILNRMQFFDALRVLSPLDQSKLYHIWSCYHAGLKKEKKGQHDIAVDLTDMMDKLGGENIQVYQNDKVDVDHTSEDSFHLMEQEYNKDEFFSAASHGGADIEEIRDCKQIFLSMKDKMLSKNGISNTPLNLYIFICQKPE